MPAKATLFNIKCESLFDFGTGPRNDVFYNPHGNNILKKRHALQNIWKIYNFRVIFLFDNF